MAMFPKGGNTPDHAASSKDPTSSVAGPDPAPPVSVAAITWTFNEAAAIARLGLTDPAKIALVQPTLDQALAVAETYCDRKFRKSAENELILPVQLGRLHLRRYPIHNVTAVLVSHGGHSESPKNYHIDYQAGIVYLDDQLYSHEVAVLYEGGYDPLPPDLELALWLMFDSVWALVSGSRATGDRIASVSVPDVGTIRFDVSGSGGSAGGIIPDTSAGLLEPYRRRLC